MIRVASTLLLSFACVVSWGVPVPQAELLLDIESGVRQLECEESLNLTYDPRWVNATDTNNVTFKMSVNGGEIAQVSGHGEVAWSTRRPGTYEVSAAMYDDGLAVGDPLTATFIVMGKDLVRATISLDVESVLYDGTERAPHPTVILDNVTLVEGVDYTVSYEDNVEAGKGKVIVTGLGKYQDEIEVPFTIIPAGICSLDLISGVREAQATEHLAYDSSWLGTNGATVRVFADTVQVGEATGVGAFDWSPIAAGDYALTFRTYQDGVAQEETYTAAFHVSGAGIPFDIQLNAESFVLSGGAIVPQVTVRYAGKVLTEGVDYELSFEGNDQGGIAKAIVTGKGRYSGTAIKQFRVIPTATCALDIYNGVRVTAEAQKIAYDNLWNGTSNSTVKVLVNEVQIAEDTKAGDVDWTPGGAGLYTLTHTTYTDSVLGETLTAQFYVPGSLAEAEVSLVVDELLYDGGAQCPQVVVKVGGETLTEGLDYTLEYANNMLPGKATVTVVGVRGERFEKTFTIRPAGICSLDIESGIREAKSTEELTYDTLWQGVENADFKILLDGVELGAAAGRGVVSWVPRSVGNHVATCRAYVDGLKVEEELTATFHVAGQDLVHAVVTINETTILYDGTERKPSATIVYQGNTLVEGVDYSLSYSKNIEAGMGVMTVTGLGAYRDIVDVPFEIRPAGICSLDIESGTRHAKDTEWLNYDYAWCGDTNENTRMQIRVNDEILANMTGVGSQQWNPTGSGSYVVTLRTYIDDYLQESTILTAYFDFVGNEPIEITKFIAAPRYPWSGKVDVDLTFTGGNREYAITVSASDVGGGTNLPMKTVGVVSSENGRIQDAPEASGTAAMTSTFNLRPGAYRLVWDADADITSDVDLKRVKVGVKVE